MKKYFLISALFFSCHLPVISQNLNTDSLRVDNLKKQLLYLTDTARVDLLLAITDQNGYFPPNVSADSNFYYMNLAYKEAQKLNYKYGMAMSNNRLGNYQLYRKKSNTEAKKHFLAAISLGELNSNPKILSKAYYGLAEVLMKENSEENFSKAEEYYKKSADNYRMIGDKKGEGEVSWTICTMLSGKGDYEQGISYCEKALNLNKITAKASAHNSWPHQLVVFSQLNMANLYVTAGDYQTAKDYIAQGIRYSNENLGWQLDDVIGMLYINMNQPDSAMIHLKMLVPRNKIDEAWTNHYLGEVYLLKKDYDNALSLFKGAIEEVKRTDKFHAYTKILLRMGKAYEGRKNYGTALKYTKDALALSEKYNIRPYRLEGYQLLAGIYYSMNNSKEAYKHLYKYSNLKDSILSNQFYWRLNNYKRLAEDEKKLSQIDLLHKNNELKDQKLSQQAFIKNFLITGFLLFLLLSVFVFRNLSLKRKNERLHLEQVQQEWNMKHLEGEKKQAELQRQAAELEMQALRAQMNPHFIFNCLSSINKFILKNETEAASDYLTRFSRLIRMVLINSQKSLIALEDELEMLRLYLDMERLRFKNSFEYNIHFKNTIDAGAIYLPPLLLQPFCENAIWHGLMHKEGQGVLDIAMTMQDNILNCTITDNGIGREMAAELNSKSAEKEKSLGLKITAGRLELLNRNNGAQTSYTIEDLYDEKSNAAGTKVTVQIRYKNSVEEYISN